MPEKRIFKACDWCRRRKIKCNGDGPPCSNCAKIARGDLCVYKPRPLSNREMFSPLGVSSASPRYNAYGMPLSTFNPPSGPGSSHSSPVDASRISSPSYSIAAPPRSQSGSPASEASGVSHPPGSGKRRRRTTADISSQELLDYVRNWDNGESPAGWSTLPPYSMLPDAAETPLAAQQNPWANFPSTETNYVRPDSFNPFQPFQSIPMEPSGATSLLNTNENNQIPFNSILRYKGLPEIPADIHAWNSFEKTEPVHWPLTSTRPISQPFGPPNPPSLVGSGNQGESVMPGLLDYHIRTHNPLRQEDHPFHKAVETQIDQHLNNQSTLCSTEPSVSSTSDKDAHAGTYTCTYHGCALQFETPSKLQTHKREGHRYSKPMRSSQTGPHICERINPMTGKSCNAIFSRPYDLTRHEDTIHNARKYKVRCHTCTENKTFRSDDALTRHMRVLHPEVEWRGKTSHRRRN